MGTSLPSTDWLFVMSDLHLCGGASEDRLFRKDHLFAKEVAHTDNLDGHVTLVLNGDVVDFLAVPDSPAFQSDEQQAAATLERILQGHPLVVQALRHFVQREHRHLVIAAGNHDPELAWPEAIATLHTLLEPPDAKGNLTIRTGGLGYVCMVGNKRVGCIHGDIADSTNRVDSDALRGLDQHTVTTTTVTPSAGSCLVVDFVRPLREPFPLIDVLKPEVGVAIMLALEMVPKEVGDAVTARSGLRVVLAAARDALRTPRLSYTKMAGPEGPPELLDDSALDQPGSLPGPRTMLRVTEALLDQPPEALVDTTEGLELLGPARWLAKRAAKDDPTADLEEPDIVWDWARNQQLESDILIAGHTHLRRHIRTRRLEYLNTGTWIPISILEPRDLDTSTFERTQRRLARAKNLEELLEVKLVKGPEEPTRYAVRFYPTVACVGPVNNQTKAWLYEASGTATARRWSNRLR